MIKIRLSRGGTKKRPVYKVVIADSRRARDGRFIEKVGFFNPLLPKDKKERVGLEAERIKYWLGQGAQPTTRVARILGENGIIAMPANGSNPSKAIPKKERKKEGGLKQHQQQQLLKQKQHQQQKLQRKKLLSSSSSSSRSSKAKKLLKQKQHQQQKLQRKKLNSWIHVASEDIHTLS